MGTVRPYWNWGCHFVRSRKTVCVITRVEQNANILWRLRSGTNTANWNVTSSYQTHYTFSSAPSKTVSSYQCWHRWRHNGIMMYACVGLKLRHNGFMICAQAVSVLTALVCWTFQWYPANSGKLHAVGSVHETAVCTVYTTTHDSLYRKKLQHACDV